MLCQACLLAWGRHQWWWYDIILFHTWYVGTSRRCLFINIKVSTAFSFIHRTMMMMMMIFLFLFLFHIFSQQQAYSSSASSFQLQLQLHSAFTSSNTDSDPNLICIVHRSMHCIALHCNSVRECQVDRQTDKIYEKFPNQTWIRYLPDDLDHRWAYAVVRFVLPRLVV